MQNVTHGLGDVKSIISLNNDGSLTTGTVQDCTAILDHTKAMHNSGFTGSADMKFAGSVPFVLIEKYCNDSGIEFREFMNSQDHRKRLLNDPAISHFRVWKGRI